MVLATRNGVSHKLEMHLLERGDRPEVLLFPSRINVFLPSMSHMAALKHVLHSNKTYNQPLF